MSKECPGQTMWEFGWRIANSEENFFLFIWEKSS